MIARTAIAATLISLTTLAAVPAKASDLSISIGFNGYGQGYGWSGPTYDVGYRHNNWRRHDRLSGEEIHWLLRNAGYHHIVFVNNSGPVIQLKARKEGSWFFVTMDAYTGQMISRERL